jgi:transcriptional regulator with XRE-family HTH domain
MGALHRDGVSVDVGARLKILRKERNVSMRTVAKQSGLSANALSMIERGLTSPSVSTLSKLAGALEVPITAFFRLEPDRKNIVFCPGDARNQLPQLCGTWESLGSDSFTGRMEAYMLTLEGGGGSGPYPTSHTGSEFVFILSGQLVCEVGDERYPMKAGDSILFEANLNHYWQNPGPGITNAIVLAAAFDADERPGEYHLAAQDHPDGHG